MKHIIILTSFLLISTFSFAQNLVPNFSFETYDSCPTVYNYSGYEYSLECTPWGQATSDPADYYNACDTTIVSLGRTTPWVGVPQNSQGYQYAYEGVAYTGILVYDTMAPYFKQYIITSIPSLEIDTTYEVTIHISLADSSRFATDAMGVLFTTYGSPDQSTLYTLNATPQVDYTSYGIISDTANWTTLSSTFIADSAYTSLIIGVFKNASDMNIWGFNGNAHKTEPYTAYYYIDNVVVEKISATSIASINNNNDVNIYPNPFTDYATLIFNNQYHQNYTLTIFNVQGQVVQKFGDINTDKIRIDRNGLPPGFYYYQLRNAYGIIANGKLIIK